MGLVRQYRRSLLNLIVSLAVGALGFQAAAAPAHAVQHALDRTLAQGDPDAQASLYRAHCDLCLAFTRKAAAAPTPALCVNSAPALPLETPLALREPVETVQPLPPARAPPTHT